MWYLMAVGDSLRLHPAINKWQLVVFSYDNNKNRRAVDFPESDTDVTIRDSASASGHYTSRRKPVQDIHAIEVQGGG